ncbi:hypothetical protein AB0284_20120 [Pseudarthrobacter phenanthrenivorans]|uniref:pentapeptide repeat-containing protein n=1 Tax=Pseudarthrobacter phenanthrenivorans TaxID=361575 RepID=UPI00344C1D7C
MAREPKASISIHIWLRQLRGIVQNIRRSKLIGWLRRRGYRFLERSKLLAAVLVTVLVAVGIGIFAYVVLYGLLPPGKDPVQPKDLTQFALTIAAGIGGVVALVVAYRRQQGIEQSRFVERFGAAASQLGHSDVAVRLAGVYAMAGVADESSRFERQQCIDVLCGYLRLPYSPNLGASHQSELQRKVPGREGEESTQKYLYRQNDKEVRQTLVRVIAAHLRHGAQTSWSRCSFDFRGAVLEDADFSDVMFRGDLIAFDGATFSGGVTRFDGARFSGDVTRFGEAKFNARTTRFEYTTFSGFLSRFDGAAFTGGLTRFSGATFNGDKTVFDGATFSAGLAWFDGVTFSRGWTSFNGATFSGDVTRFDGATFSGGQTRFERATFNAGLTRFQRVTFGPGRSWFWGANFDGPVDFSDPVKWDPAPRFDWDDDDVSVIRPRRPKPDNTFPDDWPPVPRPLWPE